MKQEKVGFIKNLLNNLVLLKWVRKFSADNLMDDEDKDDWEGDFENYAESCFENACEED